MGQQREQNRTSSPTSWILANALGWPSPSPNYKAHLEVRDAKCGYIWGSRILLKKIFCSCIVFNQKHCRQHERTASPCASRVV